MDDDGWNEGRRLKNERKEVEEMDGGSNRAREEEEESGDSPIPGYRLTQKVLVIDT